MCIGKSQKGKQTYMRHAFRILCMKFRSQRRHQKFESLASYDADAGCKKFAHRPWQTSCKLLLLILRFLTLCAIVHLFRFSVRTSALERLSIETIANQIVISRAKWIVMWRPRYAIPTDRVGSIRSNLLHWPRWLGYADMPCLEWKCRVDFGSWWRE